MMIQLPLGVRLAFLFAGWRPWRSIAIHPAIAHDHPAHAVLRTYGGLTVGGVGLTIRFGPFLEDQDLIEGWERLLKTRLIGIATLGQADVALLMDSQGR